MECPQLQLTPDNKPFLYFIFSYFPFDYIPKKKVYRPFENQFKVIFGRKYINLISTRLFYMSLMGCLASASSTYMPFGELPKILICRIGVVKILNLLISPYVPQSAGEGQTGQG